MSEQIDELVENLKRPSLWKRVFFTLGFCAAVQYYLGPSGSPHGVGAGRFLAVCGREESQFG